MQGWSRAGAGVCVSCSPGPLPSDGGGSVLSRLLTVGQVCTLQPRVGSEPRAPARLWRHGCVLGWAQPTRTETSYTFTGYNTSPFSSLAEATPPPGSPCCSSSPGDSRLSTASNCSSFLWVSPGPSPGPGTEEHSINDCWINFVEHTRNDTMASGSNRYFIIWWGIKRCQLIFKIIDCSFTRPLISFLSSPAEYWGSSAPLLIRGVFIL